MIRTVKKVYKNKKVQKIQVHNAYHEI